MSREQEILAMSAVELARRIRNKELSPLEVARAFLDHIRRRNPEINAFCTVAEERALEDAKRAEKRLMSEEELPPLLGVPIAIKDLSRPGAFGRRSGRSFSPTTFPAGTPSSSPGRGRPVP
ncbi:amidase [Planifilum fimeticola]|uniref:Amidase n=1 Tax=Planifilum fimeticola TaxID=201975 RepID=A0A2T0LGB1_9BACL|nr:amidase family protein [Planifilum fimeticola]PRX41316.1 amidase [Planifilum fimeticola]